MTVEKQKQVLVQILGDPLPELDPIYHEGAKLYARTAPNSYMTPYMLHELFTPLEMKLVTLLPGTSAEVAAKAGMLEDEVEAILGNCFRLGKLLPMKKSKPGYTPSVDLLTIRDQIGMAMLALGLDWSPKLKMFRLMDAWCLDVTPEMIAAFEPSFRVIPKYESIKDLPGVMYCENMKEIIESFQAVNKFTTMVCVCKAYQSYLDTGAYDAAHCTSGLREHNAADGHCMQFGTRGDFVVKQFGAHYATKEEAARCLQEADHSTAVFTAPNSRQISFICSCCDDCCAIVKLEGKGLPVRIPSRFRPTLREAKCIGCGACLNKCTFGALRLDEGKARIDEGKCMGCGSCVVGCPNKALRMKIVHDVDWIPDVWEEDNNWNIDGENTPDYLEQVKEGVR